MSHKLARVWLALAFVGPIAEPVEAGRNRRSPGSVTYFMNWDGGCDGGGDLSLVAAPR
jgi:hypothetical protein